MSEPYATFEAKKDRLVQVQTGEWKLTLTVLPESMPDWLLRAPMGQRIGAAALHEIGEDEKPVVGSAQSAEKPAREKTEGERAVVRAVMLCQDPAFKQWFDEPDATDEEVAVTLRAKLGVASRSELATNEEARARFEGIEADFRYRDVRK